MAEEYVLSIDQSTQGTKLLLFDNRGKILTRVDRLHRQIVNDKGFVSHDMEEVYQNILEEVKDVISYMINNGLNPANIKALGISNQRETTVCFDEKGKPLAHAIVWQCARATDIVNRYSKEAAEKIKKVTGIPLSPFFPAAKMCWLLENDCKDIDKNKIHLGTVDSFLCFRLTKGKVFATDASNASRTQLLDLKNLCWSKEVCDMFKIPISSLPEIKNSNDIFGYTDFEGLLSNKIPIHAIMGDSHSALFGQHCHEPGTLKTTYGTGSSMMLNTGEDLIESNFGLATCLAWKVGNKPVYCLEGNINYTGAVISWLKDDLGLINKASEVNGLCDEANKDDTTVIVPAFSGLSAPYWKNDAKAIISGMTRTTRKAEIAKACVESIAQQICDVFEAMKQDYGKNIEIIKADGGPTKNPYLMQFQSDMTNTNVYASNAEELSAIGVAYLAGMEESVYDESVFENIDYVKFSPSMTQKDREQKRQLWKDTIKLYNQK